MRVVIQRVCSASVEIEGKVNGEIGEGLLVLLGIEDFDTQEDLEWLVKKIINLRIFNDEYGVMNKSLQEVGGGILVISQFTLFASTKKGNRPSYIRAGKPEYAEQLYEDFKAKVSSFLKRQIESGVFGADMKVSLVNDGPVTIFIDSKNKE